MNVSNLNVTPGSSYTSQSDTTLSSMLTYTQIPPEEGGRVLYKGSDGQLYTFDPESGSSGAYSLYDPTGGG